MNADRMLAIGLIIAVVIAVVAGLLVLGSPSEERSRLLDARRVEDLQTLTWHLRSYREREGTLPELLEDVVGLAPDWLHDPRSGEAYGYRPLDSENFEVCASFERRAEPPYLPEMRDDEPFRFHGAGHQCFSIPASFSRPALKPGA